MSFFIAVIEYLYFQNKLFAKMFWDDSRAMPDVKMSQRSNLWIFWYSVPSFGVCEIFISLSWPPNKNCKSDCFHTGKQLTAWFEEAFMYVAHVWNELSHCSVSVRFWADFCVARLLFLVGPYLNFVVCHLLCCFKERQLTSHDYQSD